MFTYTICKVRSKQCNDLPSTYIPRVAKAKKMYVTKSHLEVGVFAKGRCAPQAMTTLTFMSDDIQLICKHMHYVGERK